MRMRAGEGRYLLLLLGLGGTWLLALTAAGGVPPAPPPWPLVASALTAMAAAALAGSLGVLAGAHLAFSGSLEARISEKALSAAASVPSVVLGAVLLWLCADRLGAVPGIWLVALGLGILNLPHATLRSAEVLRRHPEIAQAARALGAHSGQVAEAVHGAARRALSAVAGQAAGRSLGEAALVVLTAAYVGTGGARALTGGATLASRLWYLELQGKTDSQEAFWPVALLLMTAVALAWFFGRMEVADQEGSRH